MVDDVFVKFEATVKYDGNCLTPNLTSGMKPKVRFADMWLDHFFITGEFEPTAPIEYGSEGTATFHVISDRSSLSHFNPEAEFELYGPPAKKIGTGKINCILSISD